MICFSIRPKLASVSGFVVALAFCSPSNGETIQAIRDLCVEMQNHRYEPIASRAESHAKALSELSTIRTWQDKNKKFSIEAKCLAYKEDAAGTPWVQLQKVDGKRLSIKVELLSDDNRKLLEIAPRGELLAAFVAEAERNIKDTVGRRRSSIVEKYKSRTAKMDWGSPDDPKHDLTNKAITNAEWLLVRVVPVPESWIKTPLNVELPDGKSKQVGYPYKYNGPLVPSEKIVELADIYRRLGVDDEDQFLTWIDSLFGREAYGEDLTLARRVAEIALKKKRLSTTLKSGVKRSLLYGLSITADLPAYKGMTGSEVAETLGEKLAPPDFNDDATSAWLPRVLDIYEGAPIYQEAQKKIYSGTSVTEEFEFVKMQSTSGKDPVREIYEWYVILTHLRQAGASPPPIPSSIPNP